MAPDLDAFWNLLTSRTDAITPVPASRWDATAHPVQPVGGFLDDIDLFDAAFFGISPREAEVVDPQQRLILESVWRTLENAGHPASTLRGTRTGVYMGALWHDYELLRKDNAQPPTQHSIVGNSLDIASARVSYVLGLTGPSMTLESSCSSSLVALHQACSALRAGEIDAALVGGANLMLTPEVTTGLTHFGGLSPTGRCRAFGAGADGFVRGEGVATVYLKPLPQALSDGDDIKATILTTTVNNDGGGDSLVTPNPQAQTDLLRQAYKHIDPTQVAYIEAHGTGTQRGDLSEATAIGTVLGRPTGLPIGSVKTNIGHLEPAAGLAGLIKAILSLQHNYVPPSLHADTPNPTIDLPTLGLRVATNGLPLPPTAHIGVNSFGWGGTNAHVVLTAAPHPTTPPTVGQALPADGDRIALTNARAHTSNPTPTPRHPSDPTLADPNLADPNPADPNPADPNPADPNPADPNPADSDLTDPNADLTTPDPTNLQATPHSLKPRTARPSSINPASASPHAATPGSATPGSFSPHVAGPGSVGPGSFSPHVAGLDVVSPGSAASHTADPGSAAPGSPKHHAIDPDSAPDPLNPNSAESLPAATSHPAEVNASTVPNTSTHPSPSSTSHPSGQPTPSPSAAQKTVARTTTELPIPSSATEAPDANGTPSADDRSSPHTAGEAAHIPGPHSDPSLERRNSSSFGTTTPYLLPISAHDPAALAQRLSDIRTSIERGADPREIAGTLAHHRDHFPLRHPILVTADPLDALAQAAEPTRARPLGRTAFIFPGQGAQWLNMGRDLHGVDPAFTDSLNRCAHALGWSPDDIFTAPLGGVDRVQPALWAVSVSLAAAWEWAGVRPDVVIGHSQGEIAAATVAGILSIADGAAVVSRRAAILREVAGGGRMLAVDLGWDALGEALAGFEESVAPAVHNGPRSCVLSGDADSVALLKEILEADDIFCRLVDVDYASHSPLMDPILPSIRDALADVSPVPGRVPFLSTVDLELRHTLDADYWATNLRQPVRFAEAVDAAIADGVTHLVEISPHPGLSAALGQLAARHDEPPVVLSTVRRDQGTITDLTRAFADAYASGLPAVGPRPTRRSTAVPPYRWQRKRYWVGRKPASVGDGGTTLSLAAQPWLADHKVHNATVFPAGGYLAMLRSAAEGAGLRDVAFPTALTLGDEDVRLTILRRPTGHISIRTQVDDQWLTHASARTTTPAEQPPAPEPPQGEQADFYARCTQRHHHYGPAFRWVATLSTDGTRAVASLRHPGAGPAGESAAYWDGILQVALAVLPGADAMIPISIESLHLTAAPPEPLVHAHCTGDNEVDLIVCQPDGTPVGKLTGLRFAALPTDEPDDRVLRWEFDPEPRTSTPPKRPFTLAGDDIGLDPAGEGEPVTVFVAPSPGGLPDLLDAIRAAIPGRSTFALLTRNARPAPDGSPVDPDAALYVGMATVLQNEYPHLRTRLIDTDTITPGVLNELSDVDGPDVVVLRGEQRWVGRRRRGGEPADPPRLRGRSYRLAVRHPGRLDTITRLVTRPRDPGPGEVRVRVEVASLNFIDAMKAMGVYPDPADRHLLGLDCAGVVVASGAPGVEVGTRVVACVPGALADEVTVDAALTAPIPEGMSDADAAALPMVLLTAWYALMRLARVRPGETVLIHSGAGGVGLAAIAVARQAKATILATAGTDAKRAYLRQLGVEHVFDSRTTDWAEGVRAATAGRGVDVVLNSLAGDAIALGLDVLAHDGRFIELGKRDIHADAAIDLGAFRKAISFTAVDIAGLLRRAPDRFAELLAEAWPHAHPLPITELPFAEATDAIRHLAQGDHIGKIVLTNPRDGHPVDPDPAVARRFRPDATYLVTGGAGALGRSLVTHLLTHGARHVALTGRTAIDPPPGTRYWQADVADETRMTEVLNDIRATMPPLAAVFHTAATLDDATLPTITPESLTGVLHAKAMGAKVLDTLTRSDDLDAFVLFSSVATFAGLPGQAAYAAANAYLDALAHHRARAGLPALSVQWGPVADAGLATGNTDRLADRGLSPLTTEDLWPALTTFLPRETAVAYANLDTRRWQQMYPTTAAQVSWQSLTTPHPTTPTPTLTPTDVATHIRTNAAAVLRTDPDTLDPNAPLKTLGLDSLMSLELRNRLEASLGLRLSPTLLWTHGTLTRLTTALTTLVEEARDA